MTGNIVSWCSTPKSPVLRSRGKSDDGSAPFSFTLPTNQTCLGQLWVEWKWSLLKAAVLGSTETYTHTRAFNGVHTRGVATRRRYIFLWSAKLQAVMGADSLPANTHAQCHHLLSVLFNFFLFD